MMHSSGLQITPGYSGVPSDLQVPKCSSHRQEVFLFVFHILIE